MAVALITGASVGIGRSCALALADAGFDLGLTFRVRAAEAEQTAAAARARGVHVSLAQVDFLEDLDRARRALRSLCDELGAPTAFVNNAGVSPRAAFLTEPLPDLERTIRTNLLAPIALAQEAARAMIEAGVKGSIVNVTSVLASLPLAECGAYCASKAALAAHSRVQALELVQHGIRVNAVAPGHTATPMNYGDDAAPALDLSWDAIPMRRPAHPDEIAAAVRFLVSPEAAYVTGTTVTVDGGLSLPNGPSALQHEMGLPPAPSWSA
jgi:NAD(P)-dependent dehydrogenase (short-subunit alcohol dehydrogenase family)